MSGLSGGAGATHRRWSGALVAGVVALTVGACSGGEVAPQPSVSTNPTMTTEPEPTPTTEPAPETPEEPQKPPSWWETDETAAVDAAEYFFELYDYAWRSADLDEWNRLSGQTCVFCTAVQREVESMVAEGRQFIGGELSLVERPLVIGHDVNIDVYATQARYRAESAHEVDRAGDVIATFSEEEGFFVLEVAPSVLGWHLMSGGAYGEPLS